MTGTAPVYFQMPSRASTPPLVNPIDSATWTRSNGRTPCMNSRRPVMMFITSRSRGVKIIGRGSPVVPPLVCRISGKRLVVFRIDADVVRPERVRATCSARRSCTENGGIVPEVVQRADVAGRMPAAPQCR